MVVLTARPGEREARSATLAPIRAMRTATLANRPIAGCRYEAISGLASGRPLHSSTYGYVDEAGAADGVDIPASVGNNT